VERICVIGLGYIGLPTAAFLANSGYKVYGMDINNELVDKINSCKVPFVEKGLNDLVTRSVKTGNLTVQTKIHDADVYFICVPTPFTKNKKADLTYVVSATKSILPKIKKGNMVILESTVPPLTTKNIVGPILEKSGLHVGRDISLCHCPERVMPGNIINEMINNDRVIGGVDRKSTLRALKIYKKFVKGRIFLTDDTTAEYVKLIENTFRAVNIALANELALIAEKVGINAMEAINLANKHPRVDIHNPGPGVGGHCIPVDPWFVVETAGGTSKLIPLALTINESMPEHVVNLLTDALKEAGKSLKKSKVVVLGAAYKGNAEDTRESPTTPIVAKLLKARTKHVVIYDPYVTKYEYPIEHNFSKAVKGADALIVVTDHNEFKRMNMSDVKKLMAPKPILVDSRNIVKNHNGFIFRGIGIGR